MTLDAISRRTRASLILLTLTLCLMLVAPAKWTGSAWATSIDARTLPLCGRGETVPPHGFPRFLHIGVRPASVVVSAKSGHVFVMSVGEKNFTGALQCRSSLTTLDASTGRFIRSVATGEVPGPVIVDDRDGRVFVFTHRATTGSSIGTDSASVFDLQGRDTGHRVAFHLGPPPVASAGRRYES